jgi:uncharacterized protein
MARVLCIGPGFGLPVEAVTQTFGILAKRGAGKTYCALVLVEELLGAGQRVVVADPVGVAWGLRANAAGTGPGIPIVVFGGDHGDVPLEETAGETIANWLIAEAQSAVLDLSLLRKSAQVRFMADFCERLYHKNRAPLHVVLDEADAFAPQRPMRGQERMLGAVEDLVRRGRARGLGVSLVTQRAAVLNKDVLTQVEVLVALRTIAPQDRDAIDAWIKVHGTPEQRAELMASLPSLPIGTAWWWSPGWLDLFRKVKTRKRRTFDSSATPSAEAQRIEPKALAPIDLEVLKGRIAATVEQAKANDPRRLRQRIAELERAAGVPQPTPPPTRVEVPVFSDKELMALMRLTETVGQTVSRLESARQEAIEKLAGFADAIASLSHHVEHHFGRQQTRPPLQALRRSTVKPSLPMVDPPRAHAAAARNGGPEPAGAVGRGGLHRMLIALAQRPQGLSRKQLGIRAGLSSRSGTFDTYLSRARAAGWITGSADALTITAGGLGALGAFAPLPTGPELLAYWLRQLGGSGAARMLRSLADAYPAALSRDELGSRANLSDRSGTFDTYLSRLRALELVEGRGELRASEELFT